MLSSIKIQNFALIKDVTVEFGNGLNIITGETGAGKSIIIGAIDIAVGERGYTENIRTGEDKAVVEAVFVFESNDALVPMLNSILFDAGLDEIDGQLIIKREINRKSKGRIFINSGQATLSVLQTLGSYLIDIHGQHEHQSILKPEEHINFLDDYAGNTQLKGQNATVYLKLSAINSELNMLRKKESDKNVRLDALNFRIDEINKFRFSDNEEFDEVVTKRDLMASSETVKMKINSILSNLSPASIDDEGDGVIEMLEKIKRDAQYLLKIDEKHISEFSKIVDDVLLKSEETKNFFSEYMSTVEFDKNELEILEERISGAESLMKKFDKNNIDELNTYMKEMEFEKKEIEMSSEIIAEKEKERATVIDDLKTVSLKLSDIRIKNAKELGGKIEEELKGLGVLKASFEIKVDRIVAPDNYDAAIEHKGKYYKASPIGIDYVEFLMSLNPGEEVRPLVKIASGGEISRIMLAIKNILSETDRIPTMVFDEIDTGISGKIAEVVGRKLYQISIKKQLLCITHLPQIAAYAANHYSVAKNTDSKRTETKILKLSDEEKVNEVAKLLSGEKVTDSSLKAASELINRAVK